MTKFINDIPDEKILGEVCDLKYGKSLPAPKRTPGEYPVFGSNGQVGSHTESLTQGPTIIIGRKGSFGEVHFSEKSCWPIDTTYYIDERSTKENLKWLSYYLQTLGLTKLNRAAAIPGLNREDAYRINIRIPSLAEQDRVAALLESMDDLREKRRRSIELLDELTQSIFLEMFGDTRAPDSQWESVIFSEVLTTPPRNGLSPSKGGDFSANVLTLSAITGEKFNPDAQKEATFKEAPPSEKSVRINDFLVCRGNGNIDLVGRGHFPTKNMPSMTFPDTMIASPIDQEKIFPEFLESLWKQDSIREQIKSVARTTNGTFKINQRSLENIRIIIPPIRLQREFTEKVWRIRETKAKHQTHLAHLDELFASVQQRAFNGTLWNDPAVAS